MPVSLPAGRTRRDAYDKETEFEGEIHGEAQDASDGDVRG